MIVYISGPITGMPDNNRRAFYAAEEMLKKVLRTEFCGEKEITIINPLKVGISVDYAHRSDSMPPAWEDYMRMDIRWLTQATHIVFLPGSENSKGSLLERHIAEALGIKEIRRSIGTEEES